MITNTNTSLTLLNVGIACHQADWNWHNVRSPFARIYYVVEKLGLFNFRKLS